LCIGEGYFFFFLPVAFFAFFAFFAFLATLPSMIPRLIQCKSTSTCINIEYTTIAKLILRGSKKVNGGRTVARCKWPTSFTRPQRDTWTPCPAGSIRTEIDMKTTSQTAGSSELKLAQCFSRGSKPSCIVEKSIPLMRRGFFFYDLPDVAISNRCW
jgi:hypothetical protein